MELVRRDFYLDDFLNYVAAGFVIAVFVIVLGFAFGSLGWFGYWHSANKELKIYAALRGEEWVGEADLKNAEILRGINIGQYPGREELLKFFSEDHAWFGTASKHLENVDLILNNSPEASEIDVHIEPWDTFFILTGFAGFLFLVAAMNVSFLVETIANRRQILLYPWNKAWSYPSLVFMLPYVLLTQPILLIRYGLWKLRGSKEIQRAEGGEERERAIRSRRDIDRDRQKAESHIAKVKSNLQRHKAAWIQMYEQRLPIMRGEIEGRVQLHRSRLAELGSQVERAQRDFAEERAKLGNLERADWLEKDGGLEFDRLLGIAGVAAGEVDGDEIRVYTDTIFIRYIGIKYEIGNFLIRIGTGSNAYLKIENLCNTSNYEKRIHPYGIPGEKRFCFGGLSENVSSLLVKRDYVPLVVVILRALQSADGDAPSRVMHWRRA